MSEVINYQRATRDAPYDYYYVTRILYKTCYSHDHLFPTIVRSVASRPALSSDAT